MYTSIAKIGIIVNSVYVRMVNTQGRGFALYLIMKKNVSDLHRDIGKKIRVCRNDLGMTLEELGEKVQRDWSYLSQLERGRAVPSIETLVRISEVLEIPLHELFGSEIKKKEYKTDPYVNKIAYILKDKSVKYKKSVTKLLSQIAKKG